MKKLLFIVVVAVFVSLGLFISKTQAMGEHGNSQYVKSEHPTQADLKGSGSEDMASDHPDSDHPTSDHPTTEHPTQAELKGSGSEDPESDHPTSDHPSSDHPTSEHPQ
ncbi:MAG: hypothetical protein ABH875_03535 [Candidatus Omnitrophota bacterium]